MGREILEKIKNAVTVEEIIDALFMCDTEQLRATAKAAAASRLIFDCDVDLTPFSEGDR